MVSTPGPAKRWGILSTGGIARQFTRDLLLAGHTVAAVGSRTRASAERFAALFGLPAAHASYESLVADPTVDLIYVATPHPFHYPNAMLALEAGKHVLVEKPFTLNAAQARHLVTYAADNGLLALEAMWTRWLPHMARLREVVAAGTIGELRSMSADHTQRLPDDPGHRLNALELGGGALLDLGVYPVSFASQLFGAPASIQAVATFKETGADAQVATMFRYPGGQIATTYSASVTQGPNVAVVLGTEGRIEVDSVWYTATGLRVYDRDGTLIEHFRPPVEGRGMQYQAAEAERLVSAGQIASDILSPRRRSRSWPPSTRSVSRSACATRASDRGRRRRARRLWCHHLALADHGDAAGGHRETAGAVVLLVHPDRGALQDGHVLVQDGVLHDGAAVDAGIVQDHRPAHPGPAVHADSRRQD